ncbi:LysE family translocator [Moraxella cuniculi]|uniref:Threonine efflux protein n=1 Tax=Moraxella cuniculi TaxID=34061 RepID=A0A448GY82_9GAMM|nr:LysE family transporter [Moraxella cuniculi]VEG13804.1 Threonine efflux protein [Moraxella cuniculi]
MNEFFAVALVTILAVISPGADFAITTKNSYLYGRGVGILTATGIALGVLIHVAYTLLFVGAVMKFMPNFLDIIKYIGAAYLIYIGYQTFVQKPIAQNGDSLPISPAQALKYGLFTNALNPKTTLFVISTYTQIVRPDTSLGVLLGYGAFMSLAHFVWFAIVALLFSQSHLRQKMLAHQVIINRIIGVLLAGLGGLLLVSNLS